MYHTYAEKSYKGKSLCQFTLGEIYLEMGGPNDKNLSSQALYEDQFQSRADFKPVLRQLQTEARGKSLQGVY